MKKILVTGGAGYIGSHTVYALLDAGYDVVVVDNLVTGVRENLPDDITFYEHDVGDSTAIWDTLNTEKPDAVMHFAGSIVVPESVVNPIKYYKNNTMVSLILIEACIACGVNKFIFSSTAAVYGTPDNDDPIQESAALAPINPYGYSKLMTEKALSDCDFAHGDFTYAALRYFNVAGADPHGRTGQSTPQATHLIKVASQVADGQREALGIFGDDYPTPDGTCVRDFIHVDDLAQAHLAALNYITEHAQSIIANCGNGRGYSVTDVVNTFGEILGRALNTRMEGRRAGDPASLTADPSYLKSITDWQTRYSLKDMIASALAWEQAEAKRD